MQNMERYFGFKVHIEDELDPVRVDSLKQKAEKLVAAYDFNPEEYFVYFHQLSIFPNEAHFDFGGGLESRLARMEINFSVNQKQRREKRIKFFNFLLDMEPSAQVKVTGGADAFSCYISGAYLVEKLGYRNEIVTFVSKKVRESHRKIKISVTAYPTAAYNEILRTNKESHLTQFDFKLEKPVSLRAPKTTIPSESYLRSQGDQHSNTGEKNMTGGDTYINYGQVGSLGKNASAKDTSNQQILTNTNYADLTAELRKLLGEMQGESDVSAALNNAINAADHGDEKRLSDSIKSAGKKALDISEKIGTALVTAYIKSQLGL